MPNNSGRAAGGERIVIIISLICLMLMGVVFVGVGFRFIAMKKLNSDIPDRIYAAAVLSIVLGVAEVVASVVYYMKFT
jgi:hypothetical protein